MNQMKNNLIVCVIFVISLSFLNCANMAPSVTKDVEVEIWQLELSGQTLGKLEMSLQRVEIQKGVYSVSGKMVGEIEDYLGGAGKADYRYKGSLKNGLLKVNLYGNSEMAMGSSSINGAVQGKLYNMEGSGTWRVGHRLGSSSGSYTMKRSQTDKRRMSQ